ncbi:MAG: NosD domain-containing protein, partial [Pyrobaculum sp.]
GNAAMKRSLSYKGGEPEVSITIDGLELGASYCITVEHIPAAGLWPRETWHKSCFELPPSTPVYTLRINRTGPRILAVEYPEGVRPNTSFRVKVEIGNVLLTSEFFKNVFVRIILDRDGKPPFDRIIFSTDPGVFWSYYSNRITYYFPASLMFPGNYTLYVAVMLNNTVIDQWASSQELVVGNIIPIDKCSEITESGYYFLRGDIKGLSSYGPYCIEIKAKNVVLDGRGYTIEGHGAGDAILVGGVNVTIKNVRIKNYGRGIVMRGYLITITDSVIEGVRTGIEIYQSGLVTIRDTIFSDTSAWGIFIDMSKDIEVINSSFVDSSIRIEFASRIKVIKNKFLNSFISSRLSAYVSIIGNVMTGRKSGLVVFDANSFYVADNVMSECNIAMDLSTRVSEIVNNTISNSEIGIRVVGEGNVFLLNRFINNKENVNSYGLNVWNNEQFGNYWSDHRCVDNDDDGICDNPYVINKDNIDQRPLRHPHPQFNVTRINRSNTTAINNTSAEPMTTSPTSTLPTLHMRSIFVEDLLAASIVLNIVLIALLLRRRRGRSVGEETIVRTPTERRGLEVEIIEDKKERGDHTSR